MCIWARKYLDPDLQHHKTSSGDRFFVVGHYARSDFAFAEKLQHRFRSTHVERNAQSMLQDSPSGFAEPWFSAYRNVAKQGFKQIRCSERPQTKYRNVTKHGFKQFLCSKRPQIQFCRQSPSPNHLSELTFEDSSKPLFFSIQKR